MHDADVAGDAEDEVEVVLDDQDRQLFIQRLDDRRQPLGLGRRHARRGLVEQQQARRGRERDRDLELALLAVRERGRRPGAGPVEADAREQLLGVLAQRARAPPERPPRLARAPLQRQQDVVAAGQRGEQARMLERLRDAAAHAQVLGHARDVVAVEAHGPGRHPLGAQHELEQRALARPVGPDQPVPRAGVEAQVDAVDRAQPAVDAAHALELEQRRHPRLLRIRAAAPAIPPGSR